MRSRESFEDKSVFFPSLSFDLFSLDCCAFLSPFLFCFIARMERE